MLDAIRKRGKSLDGLASLGLEALNAPARTTSVVKIATHFELPQVIV
jgi:hypothetical protein